MNLSGQDLPIANYETYALLYKAHSPAIYGIVRRYIADDAQAASILHDIFVDLYRNGLCTKETVCKRELIQPTFRHIANALSNTTVATLFADYRKQGVAAISY